MKKKARKYINDLILALNKLELDKIEIIVSKIISVGERKNTIFLLGNGGSSATPSHSAGDWSKELRIKTLCLSDNASSITAFGNDTSYDNIFKGQLETFLEPSDIVIGYSGSGNSPNVLNAIGFAKSKGNFTIGFTGNYHGNRGGKLAIEADISIIVDTESMERIEDIHLIINHIIKNLVWDDLQKK